MGRIDMNALGDLLISADVQLTGCRIYEAAKKFNTQKSMIKKNLEEGRAIYYLSDGSRIMLCMETGNAYLASDATDKVQRLWGNSKVLRFEIEATLEAA